jgi:hypothetical protein
VTNLSLVSGEVMFIVLVVRLFNNAVSFTEVIERPMFLEGSHE